ncbi:MAG: hypothetical protein M3Z18_07780 [Gemmatimonadota bacterium]|nr:hypothetical protein [Gemmatimonadota bacterium]
MKRVMNLARVGLRFGPRLLLGLARERYFGFRIWISEHRIWRRETKKWAVAFARDLRVAAIIAREVTRHHRLVRPRYGSEYWKFFRDNLRRDFDYRHGYSTFDPGPWTEPAWSLGYARIAEVRDYRPLSLSTLPVTLLPWSKETVLH